MRSVIQRVTRAEVAIAGTSVGAIAAGLLVLLGVMDGDDDGDARWMAERICRLRIFSDAAGKMNRSVADAGGGVLVVSQFTLCADLASGNRPSFTPAAAPALAAPLCAAVAEAIGGILGRPVPTGVFGADMQVSLVNDGPVTFWLDSRQRR